MHLPDHVKLASKVEPESQNFTGAGIDAELTGLTGIKTKYNEDAKTGTHTAVWGSFFCKETKRWGFKCCKVTDKASHKCPVAAA